MMATVRRRWLGLAKSKPDPADAAAAAQRKREEEEEDARLITQAMVGAPESAFSSRALATLIVKLRRATVEQQESTNDLTERIRVLTAWLVVFSVVILILTAVQVWLGPVLKTLGMIRDSQAAWVLWQERAPLGDESVWRILAAFPGYADCQAKASAMRADVKEIHSGNRAVERTPEGMVEKEHYPGGFNVTATIWHCFPDTVDPRGPK